MNSRPDTHAIPGISAEHNTALLQTFRQFPEINTVVLYGSRAKGNHRPNSELRDHIDRIGIVIYP